ncbi:hypothetical protein JHK87_002750 [Glycine soja]|nr:hypothetical protein JHK87_002750 [Glycine soja]
MVGLNWDDLVQGVCGSVSSSWLMIIGLCCICSWYGTVHGGWQRKHNETTRLIPREDGGFCGESIALLESYNGGHLHAWLGGLRTWFCDASLMIRWCEM